MSKPTNPMKAILARIDAFKRSQPMKPGPFMSALHADVVALRAENHHQAESAALHYNELIRIITVKSKNPAGLAACAEKYNFPLSV